MRWKSGSDMRKLANSSSELTNNCHALPKFAVLTPGSSRWPVACRTCGGPNPYGGGVAAPCDGSMRCRRPTIVSGRPHVGVHPTMWTPGLRDVHTRFAFRYYRLRHGQTDRSINPAHLAASRLPAGSPGGSL